MNAIVIIAAVLVYLVFFRWMSDQKNHNWPVGPEHEVKWYQDPHMPSCYRIELAVPMMLFLLSPLGLVLGYALSTILMFEKP